MKFANYKLLVDDSEEKLKRLVSEISNVSSKCGKSDVC